MSKPQVESAKFVFSQDEDSDGRAGSTVQTITVSTANAGTEPEDSYIVIETERWAIDPDEFEEFVDMLRKVINQVRAT